MAGVKRGWVKPLAVAVLLFGAGMHARPQSAPSGSLTGKLTDLHSTPLAGATVILRNQATSAEVRTTTARNGDYFFTALEAGEYSIEADSEQLGRGLLRGILVSAGHEARVQTAMQFDLAPSAPVRTVFLKNPELNATPAATLAAAMPIETPRQPRLTAERVPSELHEVPPTQAPLLSATLKPVPLQPILFKTLPTNVLPLAVPSTMPATGGSLEIGLFHAAARGPNLATSDSIALGLQAAM
ncbi:MAG TPA: carboxypeptidase-like regulatory domain-containing protein, partial [Terracidiphilus sp.]|nr:carboxypeptidase-like regulatory domain-containing protein [Terracidiphilus sp.]